MSPDKITVGLKNQAPTKKRPKGKGKKYSIYSNSDKYSINDNIFN